MLTSRNVLALMLLGLTISCICTEPLQAQVYAARFLRDVNSARANGMGGCVVTTVGEESAYYNPASVGLLHLDKTVSFVAPHSTKWIPELTDDFRLESWSASVCMSRKPFKTPAPEPKTIALGLSYSHTRMSHGTFTRMDEIGNVIGRYENYDAAHCLAIGFGYRHKVHLGLGYAIKFVDQRYSDYGSGPERADGTAHQLGLLLELPLRELLPADLPHDDSLAGRTEVQITPTIAYVLDNLGRGMGYMEGEAYDDFPKMSRAGFSMLVAVVSGSREYCSLRGSLESEKLLVGDEPSQMKMGLEVGIRRALFLRVGKFESEGSNNQVPTYGFGFRLRGLLDGGRQVNDANSDGGFGAYFARHVDLAIDYAKYGNPDDNGLSKTWFYAVSLSL
jgi:hypothetical protein